MKYGILGDIHANLSALEGALALFDQAGVDMVVSVGDVVGYGAAPRECIHLLRQRDARVVLGNHDAAVVGLIDSAAFNPAAAFAARWTKDQLNDAEAHYLRQLPLVLHLDHASVAHATYAHPQHFDYMLDATHADESLRHMPQTICFIGHTHRPMLLGCLRDDPTRTFWTTDTHAHIDEWHRVLINVGSVGQPRDDDPRAAAAIYDTTREEVVLHRFAYDLEREQHRILRAGLPPILAERLALGF